MTYCARCGSSMVRRIPEQDNRERWVCPACNNIQYDNPRVIVSCLAYQDDRVVWVRRAEEPRRGYWVIPAGFLETDESLAQGAARELQEETQLQLVTDSLELYTLGTLRYTNEVYIVFRGQLLNEEYSPNHEVLEVGLFNEQDAPWSELAYPVMEDYIRRFYRELRSGQFSPYIGDFSEAGNLVWDLR